MREGGNRSRGRRKRPFNKENRGEQILYAPVHSIIDNSKKVKTTQIITDALMDF